MLTMLWSPWVLQSCLGSEVHDIFGGARALLQMLTWQHRRAVLSENVEERH